MVTHGTHYHPDHPHLDTHDAPLISGLPQGSSNDTYEHKTSGRLSQYIRMTNIGHPDMMVRVIDWNKQVLHVITTACHGPRLATCRVKGQDEVTTSYFSRSPHMITSHDYLTWSPPTITSHDHLPRSLTTASPTTISVKPPVGWWWPYHHLVSSWQHKISPYH